jgi:predicted RND superfamily exporter protein
MSLRKAVIILVVILLLLGVSKLLGHLAAERASSTSYLEETVRTTKKIRQMKDDRGKLIKEQEKTLLDEE